jgi:hypothetical protein
VQKPGALTTYDRFIYNYHKLFKNNQLIPAKDGQFGLAKGGQSHWLFHLAKDDLTPETLKLSKNDN